MADRYDMLDDGTKAGLEEAWADLSAVAGAAYALFDYYLDMRADVGGEALAALHSATANEPIVDMARSGRVDASWAFEKAVDARRADGAEALAAVARDITGRAADASRGIRGAAGDLAKHVGGIEDELRRLHELADGVVNADGR